MAVKHAHVHSLVYVVYGLYKDLLQGTLYVRG